MPSPYYGSAASSPDFRGIGAHLLREYPPLATQPAIDPTAPGFGSKPPLPPATIPAIDPTVPGFGLPGPSQSTPEKPEE